MAHDDTIEKKQGAIKVSETYTDEQLKIIQNAVGESGIKTLRLIMNPISDAIRMNNFILHSSGQINWTGTEIQFDSDSKGNNITLRLLMLDDEANAKTVDLILEGTTGANSALLFNSISLNNQELLYIELDRQKILDAVSVSPGTEPAKIVIENGVSGGAITPGSILKKVSLSDTSGMPSMLATETTSETVNIPLVSRFDWSDGITPTDFQDIWWIPHGIRWPTGTRSVLGAVVVKGLETYPTTFVRKQVELQNALLDINVAAEGGIILVSENIDIDSVITIPSGVTLLSRGSPQDGTVPAISSLRLGVGGKIILETRSKLFNINIEATSVFGDALEEDLVLVSGDNVEIRDCAFKLDVSSGATKANCVKITGSNNRIWNSKFRIQNIANHVGISYFAGANNVDTDSIFDYTV